MKNSLFRKFFSNCLDGGVQNRLKFIGAVNFEWRIISQPKSMLNFLRLYLVRIRIGREWPSRLIVGYMSHHEPNSSLWANSRLSASLQYVGKLHASSVVLRVGIFGACGQSVRLVVCRLGFDSLAKSHQNTLKVVIHSFPAWRSALKTNSVKIGRKVRLLCPWTHWRSLKFWLGGKQNGKLLWRYFGDVLRWHNDNDVITKSSS